MEARDSSESRPGTNGPQASGSWLKALAWLPGKLTAGPFLLLFVLCGVAVEVALLARAPHTIFEQNHFNPLFPAIVIVGLVWIWVSMSWCVRWVAVAGHTLLQRLPPLASFATAGLLILLGITAVLMYTFSWTLYLRSGQFANFEAIQFGLQNLNVSWLWHYMLDSESGFMLLFAAMVTMQVLLVPVVLVCARKTAWNHHIAGTASARRTAWWSLTLLTWLLLMTITMDRSVLRLKSQFYELTNRLNPVVTFTTSGIQSWFAEPIDASLDESQLVPLSSNDWQPPQDLSDRPSILLIAVESMRHDVIDLKHQDREVTPHLNRLAARGVHFSQSYTQSTHSDYADVCIVSSLYPLRKREHYFYRKTDPWPKTLIYDLLKPAGYATAIISSQNEAWGGMENFLLSPNLDLFYDAQRSGVAEPVSALDVAMRNEVVAGALVGKHDDAHTTTKAMEWITEQRRAGKPFFAAVTFQNSHFPYPLTDQAPRPFQPCEIDFPASFVDYPKEKTEVVRNAYFNAISYCDQQIGRLVETLSELKILDNTILVVYGENGESFHENEQVTHANKPYEPSIRVASVIHAPNYLEPKREEYPFQLIDVVPTILGIMNWPAHPNFQGTDVLAPDRPSIDQRECYVHVQVALAHSDALLFAGRWKLHHDRDRNEFLLFDLKHDPGEQHNIIESQPDIAKKLIAKLTKWRSDQLAYYHFPHYYEHFFPPSASRPPTQVNPSNSHKLLPEADPWSSISERSDAFNP